MARAHGLLRGGMCGRQRAAHLALSVSGGASSCPTFPVQRSRSSASASTLPVHRPRSCADASAPQVPGFSAGASETYPEVLASIPVRSIPFPRFLSKRRACDRTIATSPSAAHRCEPSWSSARCGASFALPIDRDGELRRVRMRTAVPPAGRVRARLATSRPSAGRPQARPLEGGTREAPPHAPGRIASRGAAGAAFWGCAKRGRSLECMRPESICLLRKAPLEGRYGGLLTVPTGLVRTASTPPAVRPRSRAPRAS